MKCLHETLVSFCYTGATDPCLTRDFNFNGAILYFSMFVFQFVVFCIENITDQPHLIFPHRLSAKKKMRNNKKWCTSGERRVSLQIIFLFKKWDVLLRLHVLASSLFKRTCVHCICHACPVKGCNFKPWTFPVNCQPRSWVVKVNGFKSKYHGCLYSTRWFS